MKYEKYNRHSKRPTSINDLVQERTTARHEAIGLGALKKTRKHRVNGVEHRRTSTVAQSKNKTQLNTKILIQKCFLWETQLNKEELGQEHNLWQKKQRWHRVASSKNETQLNTEIVNQWFIL